MPVRSRTSILSLSLAFGLATPLWAQSAPSRPANPGTATASGSQSLDQGFEDVSPLGQSLILQPIDMRTDFDFDRVYNFGDGSGRYIRRHGALNAVFPQSDYVRQRGQSRAIVPAGTVYYIGDPVAVEQEQAVGQFQALGTARRLLREPIDNSDRPTVMTEHADGAMTRLDGEHESLDWEALNLQSMRAERELGDRGVLAPAPAQVRTDVITHEPYRRERLHEMTERTVRELIAQSAAADRETVVEDLEAALER